MFYNNIIYHDLLVIGEDEGKEVAFAVDGIYGGEEEGEEEEDEADLGSGGTGLLDGYGSGLQEGEGRGILLHLGLGQLELGSHLGVGLVLQGELVLELDLFAAYAIHEDMEVGIVV